MNLYIKSFMGGVCIGIGAYAYITVGGIAGSIFFATGLCMILLLDYKLYTGMIGYVNNMTDILHCLTCFLGNFFGAEIVGVVIYINGNDRAKEILLSKIDRPLIVTLIFAMVCGVLIYSAVEAWKKGMPILTILFVSTFIMIGAEHCIADIFLVHASGEVTLRAYGTIIIAAIGNTIGSLVARYISKLEEVTN